MNPTKQLVEAAKAVLYGWASRLTRPRSEWNKKLQALADAIFAFEQSIEQPEAIAGEKTVEDILSSCISGELKKGDFVYEDEAIKAMQIYASQQTALKDQKITELTNLLSDTNKRIQEIQDEEELKDKQLQVQQSHIDDQDQLIFEQDKEIKQINEKIK